MFLVELSFSLAAVHMSLRTIEKIIAGKTRNNEWKNHEMISLFFLLLHFTIVLLLFYNWYRGLYPVWHLVVGLLHTPFLFADIHGFVNNSTVWNRLYSETFSEAYLGYVVVCGMIGGSIGIAFLLVNIIKVIEFATKDCRELRTCLGTT